MNVRKLDQDYYLVHDEFRRGRFRVIHIFPKRQHTDQHNQQHPKYRRNHSLSINYRPDVTISIYIFRFRPFEKERNSFIIIILTAIFSTQSPIQITPEFPQSALLWVVLDSSQKVWSQIRVSLGHSGVFIVRALRHSHTHKQSHNHSYSHTLIPSYPPAYTRIHIYTAEHRARTSLTAV